MERREAAAAWFAVQRRAVMSIEEREAFDAWRADPQNLAALNAMHELWGEMAALKAVQPVLRTPSLQRRRIAVGATGGIAVAVAGLLAVTAIQPMAYAQSASTAIGEQRSRTLPDGSVVNLNVATRIDYKMQDDRRNVRLREGQALFVVHKDKDRPFLVTAGDYEVRAVGTAFDVRLRDGATEIAVQEGVVLVTALKGPRAGQPIARLEAGQKLELPATPAAASATPEPIAIQSVAEWRLRTVSYEDASVAEVVADLNRFFPQPIEISDPTLGRRRITIRLQVEDRESTLRTLNALLGVPVEDGTGRAAAS
ncbi:FecR family protein [Phenylobacterium sp.]|uniref:FecR family protein n=1 Tax=Phenylobacterium sp. TaxID=1871053 RepID=UPI002FC7B1C7